MISQSGPFRGEISTVVVDSSTDKEMVHSSISSKLSPAEIKKQKQVAFFFLPAINLSQALLIDTESDSHFLSYGSAEVAPEQATPPFAMNLLSWNCQGLGCP